MFTLIITSVQWRAGNSVQILASTDGCTSLTTSGTCSTTATGAEGLGFPFALGATTFLIEFSSYDLELGLASSWLWCPWLKTYSFLIFVDVTKSTGNTSWHPVYFAFLSNIWKNLPKS